MQRKHHHKKSHKAKHKKHSKKNETHSHHKCSKKHSKKSKKEKEVKNEEIIDDELAELVKKKELLEAKLREEFDDSPELKNEIFIANKQLNDYNGFKMNESINDKIENEKKDIPKKKVTDASKSDKTFNERESGKSKENERHKTNHEVQNKHKEKIKEEIVDKREKKDDKLNSDKH